MTSVVLVPDSPGGELAPRLQIVCCPAGRLIFVARRAGIRNLEQVRACGRDEFEGVAPDVDIGYRLLDLWHVAANALISGGASLMMRVLLNGGSVRPIG